jgi:hypothetical protein
LITSAPSGQSKVFMNTAFVLILDGKTPARIYLNDRIATKYNRN